MADALVPAPLLARASGHTVLVVDDEPDIRELLTELLTMEGFDVLTAENGADALRVLAGRTADAIVLDLMMPVMDGRGFRAEQRKDPRISSIPVIVVSAADLPPHERDAPDVMRKPIELRRLVERLRVLCASRRTSGT